MNKIFIIISFTTSSFLYSQKDFKIKNIDVGFGGFSVLEKNANQKKESGGLQFNLSAGVALEKNILSLDFMKGGETNAGYASIGGDFSFYKINLLYGREFNLTNWLVFNINAGLGYYHQNSSLFFTDNKIKEATINFPAEVSLIFTPQNKIAFGLNSDYNINRLNNTFSGGMFIRYNFIK